MHPFVILLATSLFGAPPIFAGDVRSVDSLKDTPPVPLLSAYDLVPIAKASVVRVVDRYNVFLKQPDLRVKDLQSTYGNDAHEVWSVIKFATKTIKTDEISYDLLDQCFFLESDLKNLQSSKLTKADYETYGKYGAVRGNFEIPGRRFYKMIYKLCALSQKEYESRLSQLEFKESKHKLTPEHVKTISNLVFLPTVYGKRNAIHYILSRDIGTGIALAGLSVASFFGMGLPTLVISVFYLAEGVVNSVFTVHRQNPLLYTREIPDVGVEKIVGQNFSPILTPEETAFLLK